MMRPVRAVWEPLATESLSSESNGGPTLTGAEYLRLFRQSVRNARKVNRNLQTQSHRLESWMDRNVAAKRPERDRILPILTDLMRAMKAELSSLEKSLADVLSVLNL